MKERNLILTAALFTMIASLAACGGQKSVMTQSATATTAKTRGGGQREEPEEGQKPEETATVPAEKTQYEKILESGVLKVSIEGAYEPFMYYNDNSGLCGYDMETARVIGRKIGVRTEFSKIIWEGLLVSLDTGTVDLILNQVGVMDERKAEYGFSALYPYSYTALTTKTDNNDIID